MHIYEPLTSIDIISCPYGSTEIIKVKESHDVFEQDYFEGKLGVYLGGYEQKREYLQNFFRAMLQKFKLRNNFNKRAIDIGCAYGYGVEILMEFGYDAYGSDISKYAVEKANDLYNWSRCFIFDIMEKPLPKKYDLITIFNVLEHLKRPQAALYNIRSSLKLGGIVLAQTCNPLSPSNLLNRDPTHFSVLVPGIWYVLFKNAFGKVHVGTYIFKGKSLIFLPFIGDITAIKAENMR